MILVTGPTGMGKTTTLNFMVQAINSTRRAKIITVEDPVEFAHELTKWLAFEWHGGCCYLGV
jgi:twitching motility protein PilT